MFYNVLIFFHKQSIYEEGATQTVSMQPGCIFYVFLKTTDQNQKPGAPEKINPVIENRIDMLGTRILTHTCLSYTTVSDRFLF